MFREAKDGLAGTLLLIGLGLLASPWLFGFDGATAPMLSATVIGLGFLMLFLAAAVEIIDWAARGSLALGAWALVAPFLFGFHGIEAALWTHVAAGVLGMFVSLGGLDLINRNPPQRMA